MSGPDYFDDTSDDYEQFEVEILVQDHDTASLTTADIDEATVHSLVDELIDSHVVTPGPEDRILVHEPSSTAFDSMKQLAVFHEGWTAAHEAAETES